MTAKNLAAIPQDHTVSPSGKFELFRRHISIALGGQKDTGPSGGGHPFDVEQATIPPGKTAWPFHSHAAQWEMYLVQSGRGSSRREEDVEDVGPGDCWIVPPGHAHQLTNTGDEPLVYLVIADNGPADVIHYPDSNKWFVKPQRKSFRMEETAYYEGEE
ncbi:MAG TPA: cupin domain-containing protein [Chthoniobacterales bacterium]